MSDALVGSVVMRESWKLHSVIGTSAIFETLVWILRI